MMPTLIFAPAMAAEYSAPVSADPRPTGDLPDFQLPEKGRPVGAISVRVTDEADLVGLLIALRDAGADIVAINTFPATRGEPEVTRVFDFEVRNIAATDAADVLRDRPGVVKVEARKTLGQIFGK